MKKFVGMSILGLVFALTGCGGDSDSSGYNNNTKFYEDVHFGNLSDCQMVGDVIIATPSGCVFQTSKLNKGQKFSLSCRMLDDTRAYFEAKALSSGDVQSVKRDLENKRYFQYTCSTALK